MTTEAGRVQQSPEHARHDECGGALVVRVDGSTFCARCGETILAGRGQPPEDADLACDPECWVDDATGRCIFCGGLSAPARGRSPEARP